MEIDQNIVLEVCRCKFTTTKEKEKRKHYITHLEESLIDSVTATEPFKRDKCDLVEISKKRLMIHGALVHEQLDAWFENYLRKDEKDESADGKDDTEVWTDLTKYVVRNGNLYGIIDSVKGRHYIKHFKNELEKERNSETKNLR